MGSKGLQMTRIESFSGLSLTLEAGIANMYNANTESVSIQWLTLYCTEGFNTEGLTWLHEEFSCIEHMFGEHDSLSSVSEMFILAGTGCKVTLCYFSNVQSSCLLYIQHQLWCKPLVFHWKSGQKTVGCHKWYSSDTHISTQVSRSLRA